jgi:hypothetical protein
MAFLSGDFKFTGPLQDLSVYKRKDINKFIVRKKGGASKQVINTAPSFDRTRKINKELGGKSRGSKKVREALHQLKPVVDHNWSSAFISRLCPVQLMDTVSLYGQRNVELSRAPQLLEGSILNRRNPLEAIVTNKLDYTLSKEHLNASIQIPALLPGINFSPIGTFEFYRWTVVLGIVPDLYFDINGYRPQEGFEPVAPAYIHSEWRHVKSKAAAIDLELSLAGTPAVSSYSLLLAAGISFGIARYQGVEAVNGAGAGKILAVRGI